MKCFFRSRTAETLEAPVLVLALLFGTRLPIPILERTLGLPVDLLLVTLGVYTLAYIVRRIRKQGRHLFRQDSRLFRLFMGIMVFWFVWACAGLFLSPYTGIAAGIRSVYYLGLGLCTVFCVHDCCRSPGRAERFVQTLTVFCGAMVILSLAEHFVGFHFPGSRYRDPGLYFDGKRNLPAGLYAPTMFSSSLFDVNSNNLSSRIAILLPTLFVSGKEKGWVKAVKILLVLGALYGMIVNDANLAIIGMLASAAAYTLLRRGSWLANGIMVLGSAALSGGLAVHITQMLVALKQRLWPAAHGSIRLSETGAHLEEAAKAAAGVVTVQVQANSVNARWNLILDAWDMSVRTKFLGVGPGGNLGWLAMHGGRTRLVDPHCWYMEVLSQYGLAVFLGYFGSLVYMYIRMVILQWKRKEALHAQVIAMCTAFVFACLSPSFFLGFTYAWSLPALCIVLLHQDKKEKERI